MDPLIKTTPAEAVTPYTRSLINRSIKEAQRVVAVLGVNLPCYANWSIEDWDLAGDEVSEVRDCMLGWDVTDFGSNRFHEIGRTLFTLRNGIAGNSRYPKPYAEKMLIEPEGQRSPLHYHRRKREDIINRGGGNVIVILHKVSPTGTPSNARLIAHVDGISRSVAAGESIRLRPGESLTIPPGTFHQFWAEEGTGVPIDGRRYTISGEVSSVCDDRNDNVFIDAWACRFPAVIENEARVAYLCHEYPSLQVTNS
jgi:D-lyxose ketol-isomerase